MAKCAEVSEQNVLIKKKFGDEMSTEQTGFITTLVEVEKEVKLLETFKDLSEVHAIADKVRTVEGMLTAAQEKAKLFNAREALFEKDVTGTPTFPLSHTHLFIHVFID
jgi:dynein heavy chain